MANVDAPPTKKSPATASMQQFDSDGGADAPTFPGFVLLYAPAFRRMDSAFLFDKPRLLFGSEEGADVLLWDNAVSRKHALVERTPEGWMLSDVGSRNGIIVNGAFTAQHMLQPLDEVRVGDVILKYVDKDAEAYLNHRIDGAVRDERPEKTAERARCPVVGGLVMQRLVSLIERVAPTPLTVLLGGETGTGKEVFARLVHAESGRRGQLISVNCAAIPQELFESELFGVRRGAFSGAHVDRPGLVRAANFGTLFLDEVGELTLPNQAKLLRLLETHEVTPVGSHVVEPVDVRFIAATHRDLEGMVKAGTFRQDLLARLNDFQVTLPPLRERKEDIYRLFFALAARCGRPHLLPTMVCFTALLHHSFPNNVRELEKVVKRAIPFVEGNQLELKHLTPVIQAAMAGYAKRERPTDRGTGVPAEAADVQAEQPTVTRQELEALLHLHQGNVTAIAKALGRPRSTVDRWLRERFDLGVFRG